MRLTGAVFDAPTLTVVQRRDRVYRRSLVLADASAALLALSLAINLFGSDRLRLTSLLVAPIAITASKLIGLYDRDELVLRKATLDESPALFQLATLYALIIWLLDDLVIEGTLGKTQILGLWASLFFCALAGRFAARRFAEAVTPAERCLVVGDLRGTGAIGRKLEDGTSVKATLAARLPLDFEDDRERTLQRLEAAIGEHDAHRVILAPRMADSDAVLDAIRLVKSLGVKVSLLPRLFEVVGSSVVFDDLNGVTVLGVRRFGLSRSSAAVKRTMDVVGAVLGLVVVAPVLALILAAIRLDSAGSPFFRQRRVGKDGQVFEMLKFRTMVEGAETLKADLLERNETEGLFKIAHDPRITRVGRLLRRASLDELPQLVNVLRGDMSLVGPRPLVLDEDALVEGWHRRRLHLTPGMTGPWQILGAGKVPLQEMVKIDYLYIANWSFWIDVKILLRTVVHMLRRSGA